MTETIFVACQECGINVRHLQSERLTMYMIEGVEHVVCESCARELGWI